MRSGQGWLLQWQWPVGLRREPGHWAIDLDMRWESLAQSVELQLHAALDALRCGCDFCLRRPRRVAVDFGPKPSGWSIHQPEPGNPTGLALASLAVFSWLSLICL